MGRFDPDVERHFGRDREAGIQFDLGGTIMTMSIITIMTTMMMSANAAATIMTMSIITMITTMTATVAVTIMITIITITMQMRSSQAGAWRMWLLARKKSWRHFYRICLRVMFTDRFSVQRV